MWKCCSKILLTAALLSLLSCCLLASGEPAPTNTGGALMYPERRESQWTTGPRLLKLGESIEFRFSRPTGLAGGDEVTIYPRYLETANPGTKFKAGGDLRWLDGLPSEVIHLRFSEGRAILTYKPKTPGNYIAKWRVGSETLYRYFAAIEDDWIVLSFSTFWGLESEPDFHALGIPLDYRLPIEQYDTKNPLCAKLLENNRRFGELVVPHFADTPDLTHEERVKSYGDGMRKVRTLLPDAGDGRSAWLVVRNDEDPGYVRALAEIGVVDHCGLQEANCKPWLGMPEFLYYSSPEDCRKVNQQVGASVVSHQWDFCGSFHFLGPVQWHYAASEGKFDQTLKCLRQGMDEFHNLVEMSGHPAFITPLYDGVTGNPGYPNPVFSDGYGGDMMRRYVERYQKEIAFELPKRYKTAFARSIDLCDYYRRHFKTTPRTVFVSKTKHLLYDAWWSQGSVLNYGVLYTPERIPWITRSSTVRKMREEAVLPHLQPYIPFKDPMSCEFILIEEQKRQVRFERECPNPIWWFDSTRTEKGVKGSVVSSVVIPDVLIQRAQSYSKDSGLSIRLTMNTDATFPDYAIALWGLPIPYGTNGARSEPTRRNSRW